ncbi:MAG: hypothetical protein PHT33_03410 [bacterium]|nr:hypothetical protein [bacterium]
MKAIERLKSIEISPLTGGAAIVSLLLIALVAIMWVKSSLNRVPDGPDSKTSGYADSDLKPAADVSPARKGSLKPGGDFTDYTVIVDRNIFASTRTATDSADGAKAGSASGKSDASDLNLASLLLPGLALPSSSSAQGSKPADDPVGGIRKSMAFTGVVESGGEKRALLENLSTSETRFAAQGEEIFGLRLAEIGERYIILEKDGSQVRLEMGENKSDSVPGAKAAAPAGAAAGQTPATGRPGSVSTPAAGGFPNAGRFENMRRRFSERRQSSTDGAANVPSGSR